MKYTCCFILCMMCCCMQAEAELRLHKLRTEGLENPIGIDEQWPALSWQMISNKYNILQTAYEITVQSITNNTIVWKTGKQLSNQSVHVVYAGKALLSNHQYQWRVRVWDNTGSVSEWSKPAYWHTGLLSKQQWKAKWIVPGYKGDSTGQACPLFNKDYFLTKKIKSAHAYITAHGLYELRLNSKRIGDAYFTPGWTSYNKRLQYQVYDITTILKKGINTFNAVLGSGWYRGELAFARNKNLYGKEVALLMQVAITYFDGSTEWLTTDETWKCTKSNIVSSEIYDGEIINATESNQHYSLPNYTHASWHPVIVANFGYNNLTATGSEPVTKQDAIMPVKSFITPKGEQVLDYGQNLVGWVKLKVKGNKGDTVSIYHAEALDKHGNFYTANLRSAKAKAVYILSGNGEETFEPHFSFYGFRYIKIEGLRYKPPALDFTAIVLHSGLRQTGQFETSDTLINKLQHNIRWSQKGNFFDVPLDCPQRDERLGWVGDAQVFSRTAAFNMDVNNFFRKWMKDVAADQRQDGAIPVVVPYVLRRKHTFGGAGWGDVASIVPWNMYLLYGDKKILQWQYESMKQWVTYISTASTNHLWKGDFQFGDWLFYQPADDLFGMSAITSKDLIAQCFYAHSVQLLINTARVLSKNEDAAYYSSLLVQIKKAFVSEYCTPNGGLVSATQTAYVLALHFDMLPEALRQQAAKRLADNIEEYDYHLSTGFLGTPYICQVLSRFGYTDIAYKLLLQDSPPSWLYPVKMGATTIWERWDGIMPDSSFQNERMNSLNHYAYGAVGDWLYRVVGGISNDDTAPGYKKIIIKPQPGAGLHFARTALETNYGRVSCNWKKEKQYFEMEVEVPVNTNAQVYLPLVADKKVLMNNNDVSTQMVPGAGEHQGYQVLSIGSGKYHFMLQ